MTNINAVPLGNVFSRVYLFTRGFYYLDLFKLLHLGTLPPPPPSIAALSSSYNVRP